MLLAAALLGAAAACTPSVPGEGAPPSAPGSTARTVPTSPVPPPAPRPALDGDCPYLDAETVASANGQRVGRVAVSRPSEGSHPSCFFFRADGERQLSVRVYVGDPAVATAVVDQAAPVASSNPADRPSGWAGGYLGSENGAVYAIAREGTAIVVSSNQPQTIKARRVAELVVAAISG